MRNYHHGFLKYVFLFLQPNALKFDLYLDMRKNKVIAICMYCRFLLYFHFFKNTIGCLLLCGRLNLLFLKIAYRTHVFV